MASDNLCYQELSILGALLKLVGISDVGDCNLFRCLSGFGICVVFLCQTDVCPQRRMKVSQFTTPVSCRLNLFASTENTLGPDRCREILLPPPIFLLFTAMSAQEYALANE